jgi:hypothetical protein
MENDHPKIPPIILFILGLRKVKSGDNYSGAMDGALKNDQHDRGPVAELVGIEGGLVSGVFNLESSDVGA